MPSLIIDAQLYERLRERAQREGVTLQELVDRALDPVLPPLTAAQARELAVRDVRVHFDPRCDCCPGGCERMFRWRGMFRCGCPDTVAHRQAG